MQSETLSPARRQIGTAITFSPLLSSLSFLNQLEFRVVCGYVPREAKLKVVATGTTDVNDMLYELSDGKVFNFGL